MSTSSSSSSFQNNPSSNSSMSADEVSTVVGNIMPYPPFPSPPSSDAITRLQHLLNNSISVLADTLYLLPGEAGAVDANIGEVMDICYLEGLPSSTGGVNHLTTTRTDVKAEDPSPVKKSTSLASTSSNGDI